MEISISEVDNPSTPTLSIVAPLLKSVLTSLNERVPSHHCKLVGDCRGSLSKLSDVDDVHFQCVLTLAGLCDVGKGECRVNDNWRIFDPCEIIPVNFNV